MKITVQQAIALAQDQEVYGVKLIKIDDSTTLRKLREYDDFVINEALITVKEEKEEAAEFKTEPQDKDLPGGITVNEDPPEKKKRRTAVKLTPEIKKAITRAWRDGLHYKEISKKTGVSVSSIYRFINGGYYGEFL